MSKISLAGKRIIVTGASTGIGAAAAEIMGSLGAKVLVAARSEGKLKKVAAAVSKAGGEGAYFAADLGCEEDVKALVAKANELWGGVDGVFANAGMAGPAAPIADYSLAAYDEVMNVNVRSMLVLIQQVMPGMLKQGSGSIVCTGSIASERGLPMTPAYNMSKHAVLGLVRSVSSEVSRNNIRVNCVIPGLIRTPMLEGLAETIGGEVEAGLKGFEPMVPQGRIGTPEEVGWVAAFLLTDAASYINGQAWAADGGMLGTMSNGG